MADIKWIKITTTMFDDEKIKLIEAMPDADSVLVIWIKLLALAGRCNNFGDVTLSDDMPFSDEMLATIFHRPLNTIRLALSIFAKYKMIQISEKNLQIVNWEKHQNIDGMEKVKEQNRVRNVKYRDRKRLELNSDTPKNDASVTSRDGVDIDKIRLDKNIYIDLFERLYKLYPKKVDKKKSLKEFNKTVKTEEDCISIEATLNKYLAIKRVKDGYAKDACRWFRDWKTVWAEYEEESTGTANNANAARMIR